MGKTISGTVGILTTESVGSLPFAEPSFCRRLCLVGTRYGMTVYVFCPSGIKASANEIVGYTYEKGSWVKRNFPLPDIVYDRCIYHDKEQSRKKHTQLTLLTDTQPFVYLTNVLAGKWSVHRVLQRFADIAPHLPITLQYTGEHQLADWLKHNQDGAFLKPQAGTHGKRTLHVSQTNNGGWNVIGRDQRNNLINKQFPSWQEVGPWLKKFTNNRTFLLQPYLQLNSLQGEPFDVRVLMQKDGNGQWSLTGMAVRAGQKGTLTSNLHGGGTAHPALPFLTRELGKTRATEAVIQIQELASSIPNRLESHFGRLAELGIDFGVDHEGKVWLLEVNSKPGRSSFFKIGDQDSAIKSVKNPMKYARYLLLRNTFRRIKT